MPSVNLDRLNTIFRKVIQTNATVQQTNAFMEELNSGIDYDGYFCHRLFEAVPVDDLQDSMTDYLLTTYQRAICPNVDLSFLKKQIVERFHNEEYDCYRVVDFINESIGESTERLAYNQLREGALDAVFANSRHLDKIDLGQFLSTNTQKLKEIILYGCSVYRDRHRNNNPQSHNERYIYTHVFGSMGKLRSFEKFVNLILLNRGLFHRMPPSHMKYCDLVEQLERRMPGIPCKVANTSIRRTIKSMYFYKSGRVDVEFYNTLDFHEVCKALCGEEPKIHFPKSEIKLEEIFDRPLGRTRRVVKKPEVVCGRKDQ